MAREASNKPRLVQNGHAGEREIGFRKGLKFARFMQALVGNGTVREPGGGMLKFCMVYYAGWIHMSCRRMVMAMKGDDDDDDEKFSCFFFKTGIHSSTSKCHLGP